MTRDDLIVFGTVLASVILGVAITLTFNALYYDQEKCLSRWPDAQYSKETGCLVGVNGEYLPEKNIVVIKWENVE
jgi:hypothetical protein